VAIRLRRAITQYDRATFALNSPDITSYEILVVEVFSDSQGAAERNS